MLPVRTNVHFADQSVVPIERYEALDVRLSMMGRPDADQHKHALQLGR